MALTHAVVPPMACHVVDEVVFNCQPFPTAFSITSGRIFLAIYRRMSFVNTRSFRMQLCDSLY